MNISTFDEQNVVYAENQPEYLRLPAHKFSGDYQGRIACCWELSLRDRVKILFTGKVWQQVLTFDKPLQPQLLSADKPPMPQGEPQP